MVDDQIGAAITVASPVISLGTVPNPGQEVAAEDVLFPANLATIVDVKDISHVIAQMAGRAILVMEPVTS